MFGLMGGAHFRVETSYTEIYKVGTNTYIVVQVEEAPRRASLRQRGVQADGAAVDTEGRGGHITLVNGEAIRYPDPAEAAEPRERHPPSKHLPLVQFSMYQCLTGFTCYSYPLQGWTG